MQSISVFLDIAKFVNLISGKKVWMSAELKGRVS